MSAYPPRTDLFNVHPDPVLLISADRIVISANRAACVAFGDETLVGRKCHEVVFGHGNPCRRCCLTQEPIRPYFVRTASGVKRRTGCADAESLLTSIVFAGEDGRPMCFECIHTVPPLLVGLRAAHNIAGRIAAADSVDAVLSITRGFLAGAGSRPRYRARHYEPDNRRSPQKLTCVWHDEPNGVPSRHYIPHLRGSVLERMTLGNTSSFHAIDHLTLVLVTPYEPDLEFFMQNYQAAQVAENIWEAQADTFRGLRLYRLSNQDSPFVLFQDGLPHCWLDVPFGQSGELVAKISITPEGPAERFTREETEQIALLWTLANLQIKNLLLRDLDKQRLLMEEIHEARNPAFQALASIQVLRERDRERDRKSGAHVDAVDFYIKKNIETAIRMVYFLNDAPNVSRNIPCDVSAAPVNLLSEVLAPIINLFRHNEFLAALNRRSMGTKEINEENLKDLDLDNGDDIKELLFKLGHPYNIHYSAAFGKVQFYLDQYRLQQIFYNLATNASKYRVKASPAFDLKIIRRWDAEFGPNLHLYAPFYVIDVEDSGLGVREDEAKSIFEFGKRGWAATLNRAVSGTGRGLSIVREILLSMGGDIYVENLRTPTRFRVFIPAACTEPAWVDRLENTRLQMNRLRDHLGGKMQPP